MLKFTTILRYLGYALWILIFLLALILLRIFCIAVSALGSTCLWYLLQAIHWMFPYIVYFEEDTVDIWIDPYDEEEEGYYATQWSLLSMVRSGSGKHVKLAKTTSTAWIRPHISGTRRIWTWVEYEAVFPEG